MENRFVLCLLAVFIAGLVSCFEGTSGLGLASDSTTGSGQVRGSLDPSFSGSTVAVISPSSDASAQTVNYLNNLKENQLNATGIAQIINQATVDADGSFTINGLGNVGKAYIVIASERGILFLIIRDSDDSGVSIDKIRLIGDDIDLGKIRIEGGVAIAIIRIGGHKVGDRLTEDEDDGEKEEVIAKIEEHEGHRRNLGCSVVAMRPKPDATVGTRKSVRLAFSRPVDPNTISNESIKVTDATGADVPYQIKVSSRRPRHVILFKDSGNLENGVYTVKVTTDVHCARDGVPLNAEFNASFTVNTSRNDDEENEGGKRDNQ